MLTPCYDKTIEFLDSTHSGLRCLTAINPNGGPTITETFDETENDKCLAWLSSKGEKYNLYWSVGEINKKITKKAERTDITSVRFLHVDLDPRAGEDVAAEQARILSKLNTFAPSPSHTIFSGGGYQALWSLKNPIEIKGDLAKAEEAKLYNIALENALGGDRTHNIDRLLRLPGTINRPDTKKIAKGRVLALAELVCSNAIEYPLEVFRKAAAAVTAVVPPVSTTSIDLNKLNLSERVKAIIILGHDPLEPNKYGTSRSEFLYLVCCALAKAAISVEDCYSIITNPAWGISSSVLDKKGNVEKYAMRQIMRASNEIIHPLLRKLNDQFAVVESWNGKCLVIEEQLDEVMDRSRLVKQEFSDFKNRFMHIQVNMGENKEGKAITKPLGLWWLTQESRRSYSKVVFAPDVDSGSAYNLWRGFGCEAIAGDCSLYLEHLKHTICSGNEDHYQYLIQWMANAVQNPASPGYAAVVMKGAQGTGKSYAARVFGSLFGRHFMQVTDPKHLVGSFNAHLRDCCILLADEAFFAGDKKHESILKMIITEDMLVTEAKGIDAEQSNNCIHLIMSSNDHWVVPAGVGDRRFFVLSVDSGHKEDTIYFNAMISQMEKGGKEALLYYLKNLDITKFDVRVIPKTTERDNQIKISLPIEENWWRDKLVEGRLLPEQGSWQNSLAFGDLYYDYISTCKTSGSYRNANKAKLLMILKKYLPTGWPREYTAEATVEVMQQDGTRKHVERPRMISFPSLDECRLSWQSHFGGNDVFHEDKVENLYGDDK